MSLVSEAVYELSQGHSLAQGIDFPKVAGRDGCRLASGIETSFCALFCDYIKQWLDSGIESDEGILSPGYHQLFYSPSRHAESEVGYDISIGPYRSRSRARTMHKLLYASRPWCDEAWRWSIHSSFTSDNEPSGDYRHLRSLLQHYQLYPSLNPYLVLHVCHCIHDYRRMGVTYEGWQIPPLNSLLRTIVVDLPEVFRELDNWDETLDSRDFHFNVVKAVPPREDDEPVAEYLRRIADKEFFEVTIEPANVECLGGVMTLDEFCAEVEELTLQRLAREAQGD